MLGLLERCFPEQTRSAQWTAKLLEIFPAREKQLETDAAAYREINQLTSERLQLNA
ncbi:malate:quinone oxidoreductase [compost metagenome]